MAKLCWKKGMHSSPSPHWGQRGDSLSTTQNYVSAALSQGGVIRETCSIDPDNRHGQ
jgi:hypothetical protein